MSGPPVRPRPSGPLPRRPAPAAPVRLGSALLFGTGQTMDASAPTRRSKPKPAREVHPLYPRLALYIDAEGLAGAITSTQPSSIGYAADQARMQIELLKKQIAFLERWLACRHPDKPEFG